MSNQIEKEKEEDMTWRDFQSFIHNAFGVPFVLWMTATAVLPESYNHILTIHNVCIAFSVARIAMYGLNHKKSNRDNQLACLDIIFLALTVIVRESVS